jgi:hypothetical protein
MPRERGAPPSARRRPDLTTCRPRRHSVRNFVCSRDLSGRRRRAPFAWHGVAAPSLARRANDRGLNEKTPRLSARGRFTGGPGRAGQQVYLFDKSRRCAGNGRPSAALLHPNSPSAADRSGRQSERAAEAVRNRCGRLLRTIRVAVDRRSISRDRERRRTRFDLQVHALGRRSLRRRRRDRRSRCGDNRSRNGRGGFGFHRGRRRGGRRDRGRRRRRRCGHLRRQRSGRRRSGRSRGRRGRRGRRRDDDRRGRSASARRASRSARVAGRLAAAMPVEQAGELEAPVTAGAAGVAGIASRADRRHAGRLADFADGSAGRCAGVAMSRENSAEPIEERNVTARIARHGRGRGARVAAAAGMTQQRRRQNCKSGIHQLTSSVRAS